MRRTPLLAIVGVLLAAPGALAQSEVQKRTLVINGHSGQAVVYRINDKSFVALETIVQIGNGSLTREGDQMIVTLPTATTAEAEGRTVVTGMSPEFSSAAIKGLGILREWYTTLAQAILKGVPGDGSHFVVFHNRAAEALSLATVAAASPPDKNALALLSNHFAQVDNWTRKLVQERKAMSTGKYSMTPNALDNDAQYQQIAHCSKFLATMLTSRAFEDNFACH